MDDLSDFYHFLRQDFIHFSFIPIEGQYYYRPVFNASLYIIFALINKHIWRILLINLFMQGVIATTIYIIVTSFNINKLLAIFCSYMYILSHFSCFLMGQCIGVLESESMFLSLILFSLCIHYMRCKDSDISQKIKIFIYIIFFILSFTHERFISNILMIIAVFIIKWILKDDKNNNSLLDIIIAIFETTAIFFIRFLMIGRLVPTGTGRTDVLESFNINDVFSYMISQVLYILGINDGPEHLCGINFNDATPYIKNIVYISIIMISIIFIIYIINKIINTKKNFRSFVRAFGFDILVIIYMIGCIVAASVTIRLEMRWVYSTFMVFMIYVVYMISDLSYIGLKIFCILALIVFTLLRTNTELYYRSYNYMIYFMNDLMLTNDLADQTIYKYGPEVMKDKNVYILNNKFNLAGRCIYYFYEPFYGEINEDDHVVLNMIEDFDPTDSKFIELLSDKNNIVFMEDYDKHGYIRVNPD